MFTACGIGEIHETTDKANGIGYQRIKKVKHVDLCTDNDWFTGPNCLTLPKEFRPEEQYCEELPNSFVVIDTPNLNDIDKVVPDTSRFSEYQRFLRATGWILHFVKVNRQKKPIDLQLDEEIFKKS